MAVLVIVVNYNGRDVLRACLRSLHDAIATDEDVEVLLVDNASTDDSLTEVVRAFPDLRVLGNETNRGFAAANNQGIRIAIEEGRDFVYLLNPDTEVDPGFLREALAVAARFPEAAAVQSKLLLHDEPTLVNTCGNEINYLGFGYAGGYGTPDRDFDEAQIPSASGASVLLRVSALAATDLFDEAFFLYQEDADLGWRLRLAGHIAVRAPRSIVYHKYAFSRGGRKFYFLERNRYRMLLKNYRLRTLLLIAPPLVSMQVGMLVYAAFSGWLMHELRVIGHFLRPRTWRSVIRARRRVQATRRVGDRAVTPWLRGTIDFEGLTNPVFLRVVNPMLNVYWSLVRPLIRW